MADERRHHDDVHALDSGASAVEYDQRVPGVVYIDVCIEHITGKQLALVPALHGRDRFVQWKSYTIGL